MQTTGVTCAPASPYRLPDSVTIGDLGILSTLSCSDGTTQETNWRVENAGNGRALIITNATVKIPNGYYTSGRSFYADL